MRPGALFLSCAGLFFTAAAFAAPTSLRLAQDVKAEGCPHLLSQGPARILPAAVGKDQMALTFIGHATFLLETPAGLKVATDYNDYVRPADPPDVITMNRAHQGNRVNKNSHAATRLAR